MVSQDSSVVHIPSNRLEVTVHRANHGEHPMSQTNHYYSYPRSDVQPTDKPHESGLDENVEGRDKKNVRLWRSNSLQSRESWQVRILVYITDSPTHRIIIKIYAVNVYITSIYFGILGRQESIFRIIVILYIIHNIFFWLKWTLLGPSRRTSFSNLTMSMCCSRAPTRHWTPVVAWIPNVLIVLLDLWV